jgi:tRNA threonylcarbamoyladenosine biosynthesis protein TsaB
MLLLALERASSHAGAALFRDEACLAEQSSAGESARTPAWMVDIRDLLRRGGVTVGQLDRLAVGLGPGSFSGIRSAVAGFQGLGLPHGIPLVGVSSAAAVAWRWLQAAPACRRVTVLGDARRERLWVATFERAAGGRLAVVPADGQARAPLHTTDDFALVPVAALAGAIPADSVVLSPDWARLAAQLAALLPAGRLMTDGGVSTAADVARLVLANPGGVRTEPVPIYLHPPVALKPTANSKS